MLHVCFSLYMYWGMLQAIIFWRPVSFSNILSTIFTVPCFPMFKIYSQWLSAFSTQHHSTQLPTIPLHSTPLHTTSLHYAQLPTTPLHTTLHNYTPQHTTPYNSTPLHITPHNSTPLHTTRSNSWGCHLHVVSPCQLYYYLVSFFHFNSMTGRRLAWFSLGLCLCHHWFTSPV